MGDGMSAALARRISPREDPAEVAQNDENGDE